MRSVGEVLAALGVARAVGVALLVVVVVVAFGLVTFVTSVDVVGWFFRKILVGTEERRSFACFVFLVSSIA